MLLPSSKRVHALLGSAMMELEISQGQRMGGPTERRTSASGGPRFDSLLACVGALGTELDALTGSGTTVRGARIDIVVADAWLIYDIVEIDLRDLPDRTAESTVSALLADLAGVEPGSLVARWQTIGRPATQLTCAMPADAAASLNDLVRRHRLRWGTVQGEFVSALNSHRSEFDGVPTALAVMRPQGTQIGVVSNGVLAALHHEGGVPVLDRLTALCDSLVRRAGYESDQSMRYLADARQVEIGAPWRSVQPVA